MVSFQGAGKISDLRPHPIKVIDRITNVDNCQGIAFNKVCYGKIAFKLDITHLIGR